MMFRHTVCLHPTSTDGLGPNERRREGRGGRDDYRSHARVAAGHTVVAGRTIRRTKGRRGARALHRWLRLCPQDDGGQAQSFHDEEMTLRSGSWRCSCSFHVWAVLHYKYCNVCMSVVFCSVFFGYPPLPANAGYLSIPRSSSPVLFWANSMEINCQSCLIFTTAKPNGVVGKRPTMHESSQGGFSIPRIGFL